MNPRSENPKDGDICSACRVGDITVCPILERAVSMGFDGMSHCEMFDVIEKVYAVARAVRQYNYAEAG